MKAAPAGGESRPRGWWVISGRVQQILPALLNGGMAVSTRYRRLAWTLAASALVAGCAGLPREPFPLDVPITYEQQQALLAAHLKEYSSHEQKDLNKDGAQDREENRRVDWLYRTQYDLNGDQQLSWMEFLLARCPIPDQISREKSPLVETCTGGSRDQFNRLERNGDGLLSEEEVRPLQDYMFSRWDLCWDRKYRPRC
jgi:hypothetical protein